MQLTETPVSYQPENGNLARKVQHTFENFSLDHLEALRDVYATDVCFEDPIHGIQGLDALIGYFQKMLGDVDRCKFKFHRSVVNHEGMFFSWTMMLEHRSIKRGQVIRVEGASYLKIRDGKVYYHRDYFDLGDMVYENIPLLGTLIHYIRNRMAR
ncbi:MAG: nuclear transport factor 2 family protein [Gammaproteobacteria bacterium]|jgi:limonene-1,2-epoxide hydrolase